MQFLKGNCLMVILMQLLIHEKLNRRIGISELIHDVILTIEL